MKLHSLVAVPDLDTVITVGGQSESGDTLDKLYELVCADFNNCEWNESNQTLSNPRFGLVSTLVPDELITCQKG